MKKVIQSKLVWMLTMMILIMGCQRDDEIPFKEPPSVKRMIVTAQDIPDVTSTLLQKMGLRNGFNTFSANHGESTNRLSIDWDRIKQLVDTTGRETYTLGIGDNDPNPRIFYNLVIRFSENHEAHQPFLLKYTMDDDFLMEYVQTNSLKNFKGTIQKIQIKDPENTGHGRSDAFLDGDGGGISLGDPCPDETPVNGGGGGGGNDPGSGGGSTYECTTYIVTTTWYSQACSASGCDAPVVIGIEESIETECGWTNENNAAGISDDCDPETGEIPIVRPTEIRCDDDPLALMMITDYNSGKNANRFGCVRASSLNECAPLKKPHHGIDLVASIGTTVYAMYDGTVYASGTQTNSAGVEVGWGKWVMIKSTIGSQTYLNVYAHLDALPTVTGTVTAGAILGTSGDSGNASGEPHLHVEFRKFTSGTTYNSSEKVDPESLLGATFDEHGNTNWDVTCE